MPNAEANTWRQALDELETGAEHQLDFKRGRPATLEDLANIERRLQCVLPGDYREFLIERGALEVRRDGELVIAIFGVADHSRLDVVAQSLAWRNSYEPHRNFSAAVLVGTTHPNYENEVAEDGFFLVAQGGMNTRSMYLCGDEADVEGAIERLTFSAWITNVVGAPAEHEFRVSADRIREIEAKAMRLLAQRKAQRESAARHEDAERPERMAAATRQTLSTLTPREEQVLRRRFEIEESTADDDPSDA